MTLCREELMTHTRPVAAEMKQTIAPASLVAAGAIVIQHSGGDL